jgi:hypothetical protein
VSLREVENEDGEIGLGPVLGPLNSERLSAYHRLDLRASRFWRPRFGRVTFFVDIQNVYDRKNAAGFDVQFDEPEGTLTVIEEPWVGIFPSLGVIVEFGGDRWR